MEKQSKGIVKIYLKTLSEVFLFKKARFIGTMLFLMVSSLNGLLLLKFIDYITLTVTDLYSGGDIDSFSIIFTTILLLLSLLLTTIIGQYYPIFKIKSNVYIDEHINEKLKRKLGAIDYEYFESENIYEKINRVNEKVINGYNTTIESIFRIIEIIMYIFVYMLYLSKVNVFFSFLVIASIVFSGIMSTKMSKIKYKMFANTTKLNAKRDYLDQLPKDKVSHQEYQSGRLFEEIFLKYKQAYNDARDGYLKIHKYTIFAEARSLLFFIITIFAAYLYLSFRVSSGLESVDVIISLIIIFDNLYEKSESLSYYISNRIEDILVVEEYFEIMSYHETTSNPQIIPNTGDIKFENVSYTYPQSNIKALDNLNISIKSGEKIAIVGENGSGKTTFTNILLGLLTNFEGTVTIGSQKFSVTEPIPIKTAQALSQDFTMYQVSLKENILLDQQEKYSDQSLKEILNMLGISDLIETLPKGIETSLGQIEDDGRELSKGQEQKIATARIIANSDTSIWVFDEPTAYLDPLSEIDMYKFLYKLSDRKTMLFISHRLGFAPMADRIIVFSHGKAVEVGTHEELVNLNGIYAQMYETQKLWYESNKRGDELLCQTI